MTDGVCAIRPRTAYVEILYGCNLRCSYCYIGRELNHRRPKVPPLETTLDILKILKAASLEEVVLLGGEPTLHPHFSAICEAIADLGFSHRGIVTNGTTLTTTKAEVLRDTGFWVDISFRGPDAATFDAVAEKNGAFRKAVEGCLLLSDLGMLVGIEFDCIPENHDSLFDTVALLVNYGVIIKQVQLHRILPEGDAEHDMGRFLLTPDQWQVVFNQAARVRDELNIPVLFEDGFPFCLVKPEHWDIISPCGCGHNMVTVSPTGDARYCACHSEVLGNVLIEPINLLWGHLDDYRDPSRHLPVCLQCDLFSVCRGGCSASGHTHLNGSFDIYHDFFRPIHLLDQVKPTTKILLGQAILDSGDLRSSRSPGLK